MTRTGTYILALASLAAATIACDNDSSGNNGNGEDILVPEDVTLKTGVLHPDGWCPAP